MSLVGSSTLFFISCHYRSWCCLVISVRGLSSFLLALHQEFVKVCSTLVIHVFFVKEEASVTCCHVGLLVDLYVIMNAISVLYSVKLHYLVLCYLLCYSRYDIKKIKKIYLKYSLPLIIQKQEQIGIFFRQNDPFIFCLKWLEEYTIGNSID